MKANKIVMKILFFTLLFFSPLKQSQSSSIINNKVEYLINSYNTTINENETKIKETYKENELNRLLDSVNFYESGNREFIINQVGCMGSFQFKESTLKLLGYNITLKKFKKNPFCFPYSLQKEAMLKLMQANEKSLMDFTTRINGQFKNFKNVIETWNGVIKIMPNGSEILITKSAILIACHLAGIRNVIMFLYYDNDDCSDCNKTKISSYMLRFSGYKI